MRWLFLALALLLGSAPLPAEAAAPSANEVVRRVLISDPWGLNGAEVKANVVLTDKRGSKRSLSFVATSKPHDPPLSKSIVRFSSPPDLAGAGFLQIQNRNRDDDRYLFLPALRRARRISGNLRANSFMGTDFSFADLDRRDLRDSEARLLGSEKIANWDCYVVDVIPRRGDSQYSHLQLWVRADNFLPLKMKMYDAGNVHLKTFEALEIRSVSRHWFVSKSVMTNHNTEHKTLLSLESIVVNSQVPDEEFSVRALERP
ncbi:MAG: hypothetical protein RL033_6814 [Pseudomonadota bacterium]|jgi:hypothetical protein